MITDDYNTSSPILEVNSYYPFGLQQKGIGLTAVGNLHNYKNTFQKQELNEDLGVDIYEFKYRMDDLQIGRFWQVDPLADKCPHNSTYAFSENKVINGVELEGLERAPAPYNSYEVAKSVERIEFRKSSQEIGRKVANHFGLVVLGFVTDNPELAEPVVVDLVAGVKAVIGAMSVVSNSEETSSEAPSRSRLLSNGTFGGEQDTQSKTGKEAFRKAKEQNGIPRSQQPKQVKKVEERGTGKSLWQYEYTNLKGENKSIRKDNPRKYGDGGKGDQGKHYNAGPAGKKT